MNSDLQREPFRGLANFLIDLSRAFDTRRAVDHYYELDRQYIQPVDELLHLVRHVELRMKYYHCEMFHRGRVRLQSKQQSGLSKQPRVPPPSSSRAPPLTSSIIKPVALTRLKGSCNLCEDCSQE